MLISRHWLRQRIASDPDIETDAGPPISDLGTIEMFLPSDRADPAAGQSNFEDAFGVLVRQLRRRERLTLAQLATSARLDIEELRAIETDSSHVARPRTIQVLAATFRVPVRALMKLSGATVSHDERLRSEAVRFAAKSEDLSTLSKEELGALKDFVSYLSKLD
jgi:transcriptional regulator with XRE-family HTH domain